MNNFRVFGNPLWVYQLRNVVLNIYTYIWWTKSYPVTHILALKIGAQKLGRISDHLEITSKFINLEIWCILLMNFLVKKVHNVYGFHGKEGCTVILNEFLVLKKGCLSF